MSLVRGGYDDFYTGNIDGVITRLHAEVEARRGLPSGNAIARAVAASTTTTENDMQITKKLK